MRIHWFRGLAVVLGLYSGGAMAGNTFSVDWYSIDSGGGKSSAATFSVTGVIGQADVDLVSACSGDPACSGFEVRGGFLTYRSVVPIMPGVGCSASAEFCIFGNGFETSAVP